MKNLTDFHTHILPELDDGSRSVEESLKMLRAEAEQGVAHVVLTPHFYPHLHSVEGFLAGREESYQKLREAVSSESGLPQLHLGAEVYFYSGMSGSEVLKQLTVEGTNYLLVEMPQSPWPESAYRELDAIVCEQGLTPVIAHIDRYIRPLRSYGIMERLESLPVLVQANANFFQKRSTQAMALRLLRKGGIHMLGSDCHGSEYRPPNLLGAMQVIEERLGKHFSEKICCWGDFTS